MRTDQLEAVAYLNHGRWVADCPRPGCTNAEAFGNVNGAPGGLRSDHFECRALMGGCGLKCSVLWPAEVAEIERLVMCRPIPVTRNWRPGESLHDLLRENLHHGLVPNDDLGIAGATIEGGLFALPSFSPLELRS